MTLNRQQIRQQVGAELGIVLSGTATSVSPAAPNTTAIFDTSQDSPFDPGDNALRFNGAGVYLIDSDTDRFYRQNLTYVPSTQSVAWTGVISATDTTPDFEIHTEPILHPLLVWPDLIADALRLIRFISLQYISLTHRGYYVLDAWPDILGVERIRRLYFIGQNYLDNPDFVWPTGATVPDDWTGTGTAPIRSAQANVEHGAILAAASTLSQIASMPLQPGRFRGEVTAIAAVATPLTLTLRARLSSGATERVQTETTTVDNTTEHLAAEIETTSRTADIQFELAAHAGATATVYSPLLVNLTHGERRRLQPVTAIAHNPGETNGGIRLYTPEIDGVGQFALLLPYASLATDTTSTSAPDDLVKAAVAVQVLRWLISNPQIMDKSEYQSALAIWADKFDRRAREHMRKIQKTQQLWEQGELGGGRYGLWRGGRSWA